MAQQQNRKAPVRKTKKQIRRQRQLTVVGVVVVIFLIIFGLGAAWGHSLGGKVKAEDIATTVQGLGQTVQVDYDYTKVLSEEDRDDAYTAGRRLPIWVTSPSCIRVRSRSARILLP